MCLPVTPDMSFRWEVMQTESTAQDFTNRICIYYTKSTQLFSTAILCLCLRMCCRGLSCVCLSQASGIGEDSLVSTHGQTIDEIPPRNLKSLKYVHENILLYITSRKFHFRCLVFCIIEIVRSIIKINSIGLLLSPV